MAPVLIYDGDCGFCTAAARLAADRIAPGLRIVESHRAGLPSGLRARARDEVLLAHPDGRRVWGGADAVAVLLTTGPRPGLRPVGALMRLPGLRGLSGLAYRWVARNRHRMPGGTAACGVPPAG
ncbi:thiol-disulfide oxidoreductase DCC family protein [Nocardiopsis suaedae]|uniref:DUF393 domain-containing protein n=1 Tax=Nocardiopsis suaedae TaxID=3018444 RepID=A0ABT4TU92_9ACTN|nr:DUF393 domain-containing protein [Nocardiopsis suaedae]MDA2808268.1 DUF393 domain-containing protein [Nocardiopsis suaedae]